MLYVYDCLIHLYTLCISGIFKILFTIHLCQIFQKFALVDYANMTSIYLSGSDLGRFHA